MWVYEVWEHGTDGGPMGMERTWTTPLGLFATRELAESYRARREAAFEKKYHYSPALHIAARRVLRSVPTVKL